MGRPRVSTRSAAGEPVVPGVHAQHDPGIPADPNMKPVTIRYRSYSKLKVVARNRPQSQYFANRTNIFQDDHLWLVTILT